MHCYNSPPPKVAEEFENSRRDGSDVETKSRGVRTVESSRLKMGDSKGAVNLDNAATANDGGQRQRSRYLVVFSRKYEYKRDYEYSGDTSTR